MNMREFVKALNNARSITVETRAHKVELLRLDKGWTGAVDNAFRVTADRDGLSVALEWLAEQVKECVG